MLEKRHKILQIEIICHLLHYKSYDDVPFFTIEDKILYENLTNILRFWIIWHKKNPIKISEGTRDPCLLQLFCQKQTRGSWHAEQWKGSIICNLTQLWGSVNHILSEYRTQYKNIIQTFLKKREAHRKLF